MNLQKVCAGAGSHPKYLYSSAPVTTRLPCIAHDPLRLILNDSVYTSSLGSELPLGTSTQGLIKWLAVGPAENKVGCSRVVH